MFNLIHKRFISLLTCMVFGVFTLSVRNFNSVFNSGSPEMCYLNTYYFAGYAFFQIFSGTIIDSVSTTLVRLAGVAVALPSVYVIVNGVVSPEENMFLLKVISILFGMFSTPSFLCSAKDASAVSDNEKEFQSFLGSAAGVGALGAAASMFLIPFVNYNKKTVFIATFILVGVFLVLEFINFITPSTKKIVEEETKKSGFISKIGTTIVETVSVLTNFNVLFLSFLSLLYTLHTFGFYMNVYTTFIRNYLMLSENFASYGFSAFFISFAVSYVFSAKIMKTIKLCNKSAIVIGSILRIIVTYLMIVQFFDPRIILIVASLVAGITSSFDLIFFSEIQTIVSEKYTARGVAIINMTQTGASPIGSLIIGLTFPSALPNYLAFAYLAIASSVAAIVLTVFFFGKINRLLIKIVGKDSAMPIFMTKKSACMDIKSDESITIEPGSFAIVKTGIYLKFEPSILCQILPRSSLISKGFIIPNAPGVIDSDYKDEIKVILFNVTKESKTVSEGERIAQIFFSDIGGEIRYMFNGRVTNMIADTERSGGFGSTN